MRIRNVVLALCLGAASLLAAVPAQATPVTYSFDTSMLDPLAGTYSLDFQLVSPDYPVATGNTATIDHVSFGGGSATGTGYYGPNGGVSGDLVSTPLTLFVAGFFNSFTADFVPGSLIAFDLDLTNIAPAGLFPDQFSFAILLNGIELATSDPTGANKLLTVDLTRGAAPSVNQYALPSIPEPGTLSLLTLGLVVVAFRGVRRTATPA